MSAAQKSSQFKSKLKWNRDNSHTVQIFIIIITVHRFLLLSWANFPFVTIFTCHLLQRLQNASGKGLNCISYFCVYFYRLIFVNSNLSLEPVGGMISFQEIWYESPLLYILKILTDIVTIILFIVICFENTWNGFVTPCSWEIYNFIQSWKHCVDFSFNFSKITVKILGNLA